MGKGICNRYGYSDVDGNWYGMVKGLEMKIQMEIWMWRMTMTIDQGEEWAKFRQAVQQDMMRPSSALYYIRWTFHLYKRMVIALEALNIMMQGDCTIDIRWIFHCVQLNP